jgi:glycosyltransferase involved in cell wall biosynthesis
MQKKILMIGTALDVRGGISAVVNVYIAQGLFARRELHYIATHCDGGKLRKAMKALRAWVAFMARLLTGRVALLHVHIASDASFLRKSLFVAPAHWLGVPYVLHMHGGRFLEFYRDQSGPALQRFIRHVYRNARGVIALSDQWRETLLEVSPTSRVVVVPNPVQVGSWQAPLEGGAPTVLFLGLIKEAKGVRDLVASWPAVRSAVPDARLVLAGVGAIAQTRELARQLGVEDALETPGWIVGDERDRLMKRAWVFALPSHTEALPMSILESMAAGIPVVATRVGGVPTAVDHERTGVLIDVGDVPALARALSGLLADSARRKAMGAAGRRRVEATFAADVIVPRIEALWDEILQGRARRTPSDTL